MQKIEIRSLNVGKPRDLQFGKKEITTGINKKPVSEPVFLSTLNFTGDGQGDLVNHGGRDKAVCVYPYEHYPYWEKELGKPLDYSAFGENLTLFGLTEHELCIGDSFQIGEAVVQVSQPRQPCFKLSLIHDRKDMPLLIQNTGYTGYYLRVLKEGMVSPSDQLEHISRPALAISVTEANRLMHHDKDDVEGIREVLKVEELSESWRKTFLKRLEGIEEDTSERLTGR
ncbi:MOSC domain-containing protein [Sporosarcina sp. ACRSL]|uniref:MOSC domain-containing protein n=1 Tax=Sporosarcina sp. ACRSL TaxID=2918215 RepID=UPI001EF5A723|nr:MOSC domain-containing protein [Sporosarcina sp. ACRSL]MCG7343612.1 MOSC domain-containing protein [Sporosarcina sp. ACRSL]